MSEVSKSRSKFLQLVIDSRVLPEEVLAVLELVKTGDLVLTKEEFDQLTKALLKAEESVETTEKIGGVILG